MNRVCVMLSTYNGEYYVEPLIKSIVQQKNIELNLIVRDDGSSDSTVEIIENLSEQYGNIKIIKGENLGVIKSFLSLVKAASSTEADFYAFADQDDIWLDDKLIRAITHLSKYPIDKPNLYCSNLKVVDENLNNSYLKFNKSPSITKQGAIIRNYAYGCTSVYNKTLFEMYVKTTEARVWMHDFWPYLIAVFLGNIIFDMDSRILYRQHSNNVIGAQEGLRLYRFRPKHIKKVLSGHPREDMLSDFYNYFKNMLDTEDAQIILRFLNYPNSFVSRVRAAFDKKYQVYDGTQNLYLVIKFLIHVV